MFRKNKLLMEDEVMGLIDIKALEIYIYGFCGVNEY